MQRTAAKEARSTPGASGSSQLLRWPHGVFDACGKQPLLAHHRLHDMSLFTDEVLVDLLDHYPRNRLQAWTMGTDPLRREDWRAVDTTGASGKELLAAVKSGRLWYNILRLDLFDRRYRDIVDTLYSEMATACPGFKPLSAVGTLLLSSPRAMVYYHADGPLTTLFHIRGYKRMWIYPVEERFVSQRLLEEIFGSAMDEEIPYSPEFDKDAAVYDLNPGDLVWWPQNAPHRIENKDSLNVSLSTRYHTDESERRKLVYNANRFFRKKCKLRNLAVNATGLSSSAKCLAYQLARRAGLDDQVSGYVYTTNLRVDASAPSGIAVTPEFTKPPFSR